MYKLKDIMEMLNMPERTIRRHIKLGLLKGVKAGGTWRFDESDLHNYFNHPAIKQSQNHVKVNEVFDYLNGISNHDDDILIIKQIPKLSLKNSKDLSLFVSQSSESFYFNLETKMGKSVITYRARQNSCIELLNFISKY